MIVGGAASSTEGNDVSLYSGSSGVLLFFVELLATTTDPPRRSRILELLLAGGDELLAVIPATENSTRSKQSLKPDSTLNLAGEGCGLYTGIAGVGFVLEEIGRATGERRFHDGAVRCVDLLHQSARVAGCGIEWSDTTDVIAGSAGIGCFLLDMSARLRESDAAAAAIALELATRAGRRLIELSQREASGRSWRMDPTFPRVMPNFSHGTAGVAFFLARLADVTHETSFLDAARDGADHLLAIADLENGGCLVGHDTPDQPNLHYLGWCHGPCGTARLFAELARQTGDPRYSDAERRCVNSLLTSGLPTPSAPLDGFWNNVGVCCGSAGVVEFLLGVQHDVDDVAVMPLMEAIADDVVRRGARDEHGLRFVQAEHRTKPELLEAQTGYMQGAAGVGIALLHLEDAERGRVASVVLPDVPRAWRGPVSP